MRKRRKSKPLTPEIVQKYMDTIEHFFIPSKGGWPIWYEKEMEGIMDYFPQLKLDKQDRIFRDKRVPVNPELYSIIFKEKVLEMFEEFEEAVRSSNV